MANRLLPRLFFKKYKKKIIFHFFGVFQQVHEFIFLPDALEIAEGERHVSGAENLSAFPAAAIDHFTSALGLHARPEAMIFLSFQIVGLKRSFHQSTPYSMKLRHIIVKKSPVVKMERGRLVSLSP
jgi:hypothetical protein